MGHMVGKDVYRKLGKKIDGLSARAPWNDSLYEILRVLYTTEEADLIVRMPYSFSTIEQLEKATGCDHDKLRKLLDGLSDRGLVMDILWPDGCYRYMISPLIIGIFEFTMMRTGESVDYKKWAKLFHSYLGEKDTFYRANFKHNEKVMPLRAIPHEETVDESQFTEILDYEKATAIIEDADAFAIGICSCRHEKLHLNEKCEAPLETCSTFGRATDYMTRHGFAREASKSEMLDNLARSKEMGLVLCADNVKKDVSFICHCCGCCCNALAGLSKFGYPNAVVTSNYIARCDAETCAECGECAEACPINAIEMRPEGGPEVDKRFCLGCGVCALKCPNDSMKLFEREQRTLHPEDTFERVILQCLERGTLQNLMFSDTQRLTHQFMRGVVGGFLRLPPVKRSLMSDALRSRFLSAMKKN